ncbi:MAG: PIN domain-containing protein [Bellilinea sp.]
MSPKKNKAYAFLDTNLHLHFKQYDQIDWSSELGYKNTCLIVDQTTISELDKFKYDPHNQKRRERAKNILKKMQDQYINANPDVEIPIENRKGASILFLSSSSDVSKYRGLQKENMDDHLIASILTYKMEHSEIDPNDIFLIAADNGILIKAQARNIKIHQLSEKYKLPDEPTDDQRKITILEDQLKLLKSTQPRLSLSIVENDITKDLIKLQIKIIPDLTQGRINEMVELEREEIKWSPPKPPSPRRTPSNNDGTLKSVIDSLSYLNEDMVNNLTYLNAMSKIQQSEIDRYNTDTEKYLNLYKGYLIEKRRYEQFISISKLIVFNISNVGNNPAMGAVIRVSFPDGIAVFDWNEIPIPPKKPIKPLMPRNQQELFLANTMINTPSSYYLDGINRLQEKLTSDPDTLGPSITRRNGFVLEWTRPKIMHRIPYALPPIGVTFPNQSGDRDYIIPYTLFAENLIDPVEGQLKISCHSEITN